MVLRGFEIYWYRKAESKAAKYIYPLPTKKITIHKTKKGIKYFVLEIKNKKIGFKC